MRGSNKKYSTAIRNSLNGHTQRVNHLENQRGIAALIAVVKTLLIILLMISKSLWRTSSDNRPDYYCKRMNGACLLYRPLNVMPLVQSIHVMSCLE